MKALIIICFVIFPNLLIAQTQVGYNRDTIGLSRAIPPRPNRLVNDYTNTLSAINIDLLENKLERFDKQTTVQIAIVIFKSVGKFDIMQYGKQLGNSWGIGQKGKNNGVLILVAINDRKTAILTGESFENVVPDSFCSNIIQEKFRPNFKTGNYYIGLNEGVDELIKHITSSTNTSK